MLPAFAAFDDRSRHHTFDEGIAHIGKGSVAIQPRFGFHLYDAVLQKLLFIFIELQFAFQRIAALNELGGAKAGGNTQPLGVVGDEMDHGV